ncbi:MAG: hypothetical protein JWN65_441, partial [Solirubrobacterales bacterium]|nr:hypothetical protein [Solirubrobacterales bacterium]
GSAASFASPGLTVTVPADRSTTFRATATDGVGNTSACSTDAIAYVNDSSAPAAPALTATLPASPSADTAPRVLGSAEPDSTVRLYTTTDCSGAPVITGSAAALASSGLAVTVASGAVTTFHATATDAVGNVSACSAPGLTYAITPPPPTVCPNRRLLLTLVGITAGKVRVAGIAEDSRAGQRVWIVGTGARGGSAIVAADGSFAASLPAPPKLKRDDVRYEAQLGGRRSFAMRLTRAFAISRQQTTAAGVRVTARMAGLTTRRRVQITRDLDCASRVVVRTFKPTQRGTVTVTLARPQAGVAVYRLQMVGKAGPLPTLPVVVRAAKR